MQAKGTVKVDRINGRLANSIQSRALDRVARCLFMEPGHVIPYQKTRQFSRPSLISQQIGVRRPFGGELRRFPAGRSAYRIEIELNKKDRFTSCCAGCLKAEYLR